MEESYNEGGRADVRGELTLERTAILELIARCDDPEAHGLGVCAADPPVNKVVLVIQRVLVLVINLNKIQRVTSASWLSQSKHVFFKKK
jgi:hypothetical protein